MKKILALVIILVILIFGGYYAMGYKTQSTFEETIALLNRTEGVNFKIISYDRGLFQSNALVEWKVHKPAQTKKDANGQMQTIPAKDYQFKNNLTIYHGPFIFAEDGMHFAMAYATTSLNLTDHFKQEMKTLFSDKSDDPKLNISFSVSYLDKVWLNFDVPAFTLFAKKDDGKFEWLGMQASTSMSSQMESIEGIFDMKGFNLINKGVVIQFGSLDMDYDMNKLDNGLYVGSTRIVFPDINVSDKKKQLLEVKGIKFSTSTDVSSGLLDSEMTLSLVKLMFSGQSYGPGELDIALRNLDADVLAKINQQAMAVKNESEFQKRQAMMALVPEIPALFSKGAELEIKKLSMLLPQGRVSGHLLITAPEFEGGNPVMMMTQVKGKGRLQMPSLLLREMIVSSVKQQLKKMQMQNALANQIKKDRMSGGLSMSASKSMNAEERADQILSALVAAGVLVKQGSDYVIAFTIENGQILVNGRPFDGRNLRF